MIRKLYLPPFGTRFRIILHSDIFRFNGRIQLLTLAAANNALDNGKDQRIIIELHVEDWLCLANLCEIMKRKYYINRKWRRMVDTDHRHTQVKHKFAHKLHSQ